MIARRLIIALALSLCGSAIFTIWLSRKFSKSGPAAGSELHYVATAQNMQAGDVLTAGSLKLVPWPSSAPLEGSFPKPEALVGRIVLYPLASGQPILDRQLAAAGASAGLSMKIPDGMRAISLRSDQVVGVAGFLLPGTHVDVLVTFRTPNTPDPITTTVLQDAQVIATGQKMEPDPEGKATTTDVVTLLVGPDDAQRVVEASSQGTVHFILRNGSDHEKLDHGTIQLSQLGSVVAPVVRPNPTPFARGLVSRPVSAAPSPAPATPAKPYVVQMVYGEKSSPESSQ